MFYNFCVKTLDNEEMNFALPCDSVFFSTGYDNRANYKRTCSFVHNTDDLVNDNIAEQLFAKLAPYRDNCQEVLITLHHEDNPDLVSNLFKTDSLASLNFTNQIREDDDIDKDPEMRLSETLTIG